MPRPKPVSYSDMTVRNVFPSRGKTWCRWEEDFLIDWLEDFGLQECARQLGRTPASVALRCAWLGIRKPKPKAEAEAPVPKAEPNPEPKDREKAPECPADAKEAPSMGKDKADAKAEPPAPSESKSSILDMVEPAEPAPQKGEAEIIPAAPLPDEQPAEARATRSEGKPFPQAQNLGSMSRLDILKAFARGEAVEGIRV